MDPVTHVLSAALWTEPLTPPRVEGAIYARWRERAALALGALMPDADGVLGWIDLSLYERYHRVATHSALGLVVVWLLAAGLARAWPERWLLPFLRTRAGGQPVRDPRFVRLLLFAAVGLTLHFLGDLIGAWGIWPAWPFLDVDISLARVNSLEPALCGLTIGAWAVQHWLIHRSRRRAAWATAGVWLLLCVAWVVVRPGLLGEPFI